MTLRLASLVSLAVAVVVVSVTSVPGQAARADESVRMAQTPSYISRLCRSARVLIPACPSRIPYIARVASERAYDLVGLCRPGLRGCLGVTWNGLELGASGNGVRPPIWTHLAIFAGRLTGSVAFPFRYPDRGQALPLRNGVFAQAHSKALFFGQVRWDGKPGTLVLAPSFPTGGEQADHLIFRWRHGSVEYAIGLHGWEPFLQTVSTLKAIVASTPN